MKCKFSDVDAEINKIKSTPKTDLQTQTRNFQPNPLQSGNKYPAYWGLNQSGSQYASKNVDIMGTVDLIAVVQDQAVMYVESKVILCTPALIDET